MTEIQEQFNKVIFYSQGIKNPQTDELFRQWKENKQNIIDSFGGKLIYEYPYKVQFQLDEKAKEQRVTALQDYCIEQEYYDLSRFINHNRKGFFDNKVVEEYVTKDGLIVPKGMKLCKAFKYFIKDNQEKLNDFQMKASNIIQEDKVEGYLCLSVHPFDYLSSSENNYNWRSCHSLNGSYRAGNLSYMGDESTIVCYLRSEQPVILPHFPPEIEWNDKKWRMLIHINKEQTLAYAGRQYPFFSETPLNIINEIMINVFKIGGDSWTQWQDHYYTNDYIDNVPIHFNLRYLPLHKPTALGDTMNDNSRLHYNDIFYSHVYTSPFYSCATKKYFNKKYLSWSPEQMIKVGCEVECLDCGQGEIEPDEGTMRCFNCELAHGTECNDRFGVCSCCGERIFLDDAYYSEYNNRYYCRDCERDNLVSCEYCDTYMDMEDMQRDEDGCWICSDCLEYKNEEDAEY